MQVFLLRADSDYHVLRPEDGAFWLGRSGTPVSGAWRAPRLLPYDEAPGEAAALLPVDCLPLDAAADGLVLSERGRTILGPLLEQCGELWPVRVRDSAYWWFNCLASVDVLAPTTQGEWVEAADQRFLAAVRRLDFLVDGVLEAPPVFRVPELPAGYLFARDSLREAVGRSGLLGFRFDAVWRAQGGGVMPPPGFGVEAVDEARAVAKRAALLRR